MHLYAHGFWNGFFDKTDACHIGFFEHLLSEAFDVIVTMTHDINTADVLLEGTHSCGTLLNEKMWKYSVFFCGEGWGYPLPSYINDYSFVLGSKPAGNFIPCPLYISYEYCKSFEYPLNITHIPTGDICSVLSTNKPCLRTEVLLNLSKKYRVDMGGQLDNNIGYTVPGSYFDRPILDFYKKYKVVTAFENAEMDYYITEKIINPIRAGTVPLYLGSPIVSEYIHESRFVYASDERDLEKVLHSPEYYLSKVNSHVFKKTTEQVMREIAHLFKI